MRWSFLCGALLVPVLGRAQPAAEPAPAAPDLQALTGEPPPSEPPPAASVTPAPLPPAPSPLPAEAPPSRAATVPAARTGFQMHFVPLTAFAVPVGDASGARRDSLGGRYGWQWIPLELGLGAKVTGALYFGAYLSLGVGYEGSDSRTSRRCEAGQDVSDDVSCSSTTVHAGLEARYSFAPADSLNGWVGYGFGMTSGNQTISDAGRYRESTTARGLDVARLSGGLDFRPKKGFGLGPYGVVSVGRYLHTRSEIREDVTFSGDIAAKALHAWVSLGLRMVVLP